MTTRQATATVNAASFDSLKHEQFLQVMEKNEIEGEPIATAHCKKHSDLKDSVESEFIKSMKSYGKQSFSWLNW